MEGCGRKIGPYPCCSIITGDAKELAKAIPDESVDLIFTDPPYEKAAIELYGELSCIGNRVLKVGHLCITLAGWAYLDGVMLRLSKDLKYYWGGVMLGWQGMVARYHPRQMLNSCKPVLWYSKGNALNHAYVFDWFQGKPDKRWHEWGQDGSFFEYYINKLTQIGDMVFDPFCGGGTVPAVCKILSRHYLAFEIDPDVAERARERVRNTQPPLFVMQPQQLEL